MMDQDNGRSPLRGSGHQPTASASEEWRDVVGYEGLYEVSSFGCIRSRYAVNGHVLSTAGTDKDGYPVVSLTCRSVSVSPFPRMTVSSLSGSAPDGRHTFALHRLVALAFHGEKRNALHREVAHLDGDKTNPRADNLKWCSKVENHFHMRAHGTLVAGERHPRAKLTSAEVMAIRAASGSVNMAALGRQYGVSRDNIRQIRKGQIWRTI